MENIGMTIAMVIGQCLDVGKNTLVKEATNNGMNELVFIVYSNLFSFSFLLPCTLLFYYYFRNRAPPPPISTSIIGRIFLLAFLWMENLDLRVRSSQAKCVGTVVSIIGALVVTLYRGLPITILPQQSGNLLSHQPNWLLGGILLALSSVFISLLNIVQTWILKDYPTELMVATISFGFSTILSAVVAFFTQRNPKYWILRPNVELSAIFYTALFHAFIIVMNGWACRKKGPVYVAIFSPLGIVIALCMGIVFLGDTLFLGRMIGCVIIAIGFYGVIWGIAQERKKMVNHNNNEISTYVSSSTPLLYNKSIDTYIETEV